MKYDPDRMTRSRQDAADAVAQIHPVGTARALHRTIVDSEHDSIALAQRDNDRPGLHPRALFRHHEFTAREVLARFG